MSLNENIKTLRQQRGMTQTELGEAIGVGKTTISSYETGNSTPDDQTKIRIADFFWCLIRLFVRQKYFPTSK